MVELASMIAGEKFTDRPKCVCPVVGSFLRCWNDHAGYADRQRLRPYASRVVGTGGYRRISRIRRDLCLSYAGANLDRRLLGRAASRLWMRFRIAWAVGFFPAVWLKEGAGVYAAQLAVSRGGGEQAFAMLDRLLEIGSPPPARNGNVKGNGNVNANGNGDRAAELAIKATIVARERARSRAARASGSAPGATAGRRRERQVAPPRAGS